MLCVSHMSIVSLPREMVGLERKDRVCCTYVLQEH